MALFRSVVQLTNGQIRLIIGGDLPQRLYLYLDPDEGGRAGHLDRESCIALATEILSAAETLKSGAGRGDANDAA